MKKLIAKTNIGTEYLHSKSDVYFVSKNAEKIADILNRNKYKLSEGERWRVYNLEEIEETYVNKRIFISKNGRLKTAIIN
jgi:hypothetical protein